MNLDIVLLAHGSGGRKSAELIQSIFTPAFGNPVLARMDDSAVLDVAVSLQLTAISCQSSVGNNLPGSGRAGGSSPAARAGETPALPAGGLPHPDRPIRPLAPRSLPPSLPEGEGATQHPAPSTQHPTHHSGRLAITTDSHVVKPLFFEGGDIGRLAVCGTVNDLAMVGARPLYLTAAFVLEEGLSLETLKRVALSMREAADEAGICIVAGDTKVVERGSADGLFVTTTGVGLVAGGVDISGANARPGDVVILSGSVGEHGMAVLSRREGLEFGSPIASDVAPLNHLVAALLEAAPHVRSLRDPTRGGLATTLNELAAQSVVSIQVEEALIPVESAVRAACEMLGYDPLYVANEGKLVAILPQDEAGQALSALRRTRYGEDATVIGTVCEGQAGRVVMKTRVGGTRIVQMLTGELLPRIC